MKIIESLRARWIVWVWRHTPNCAEMSRLASRSLEQPPPLRVRLKMRLHHLICAWCRRYSKQLQFLHQAAPHCTGHPGALPGRKLSAHARARMVQCLRDAEEKGL